MRSAKSLFDFFWVLLISIGGTLAGAFLGVSGRMFSSHFIAGVVVFLWFLSLGMVWYTWRRLQERKVELELMQDMEAELLAAKSEAEKASLMKDEFLANVSHELRTPLNGVIGMINLLRLSDLNEDQREYCDLAMESAEQQLAVIDDLIDFSRIETGRLMLVRREFDAVRVAETLVEAFLERSRDKGLEISFELKKRVPSVVLGDEGRFRQILFNLIDNAVKYTEKGGVRVSLTADCNAVGESGRCTFVLEVADTGIGIPREKQEAIFGKFTQVDGSLTRLHGGSGLGLTIVKSLAELMHGGVSLASAEGKGTVFTVFVPLEVARESFSDEHVLSSADRQPLFTGYRVLVVEDEWDSRVSLARFLEDRGHAVFMTDSHKMLLSMLERESFDCVLMDVRVSGMNGVDVVRHIRRGASGGIDPSIPIIAVTSLTYEEGRSHCFEAGMDACVFQPEGPEKVLEEMMQVMARKVAASS